MKDKNFTEHKPLKIGMLLVIITVPIATGLFHMTILSQDVYKGIILGVVTIFLITYMFAIRAIRRSTQTGKNRED